jgi:uncharacterized protein (TIGR03083 family)
MNKPALLSSLATSRQQLLAAIDGLSDEELTQPGAMDDWSVKDLLSHLTAWEAELVKLLAQLRTSKRPAYFDLGNVDDLNAKWHKETKKRPLDRVLADFEGVRKQTLRRLESYSNEELTDPKKYKWFDGRPLWRWVAAETFEHEAEHAEQIKQWRKNLSR